MSSGADLFVVCKQCGSEVSPYITECPYCGTRLRRRAPKLPREHTPQRASHRARLPVPSLGRLRRGEIAGVRADAPPYATIALVAASCVMWVLTSGGYLALSRVVVVGPLQGDWWKLLTTQFGYLAGSSPACTPSPRCWRWRSSAGCSSAATAPSPVLVAFFGAGASGALVALAVYPLPIVGGANAGALALLAAWAVPDLRAARAKRYYDGDLLGTATIAAVLLAMPFAGLEASWLAGVTGAAVGLVLGYGLVSARAGRRKR